MSEARGFRAVEDFDELGHTGDILIEVKPKEDSIPAEVLEDYYKKFGLKILLT